MEQKKNDLFIESQSVEESQIIQRAKKILINNNILTVGDLISKSKQELKLLKGMGNLCIASIDLFLKEKGLKLKKEAPNPEEKEFFTNLIKKFVKEESINWGREIKAAKLLFSKKPDKDFWHKLYLPFKLNSLLFFLSEKGKVYLTKKKTDLIIERKPTVVLQNENLEQDIVIQKPKSIKDFLNGK